MGFRRAKRDRWISGVCGGIAHHYGWRPNVVRLVTVLVSILIPGFSVIPVLIIYAILAYVIPEGDF